MPTSRSGELNPDKAAPLLEAWELKIKRRRDYPAHLATADADLQRRSRELAEAISKERAVFIEEWAMLYPASHLAMVWNDDTVSEMTATNRLAVTLAEHWCNLEDWRRLADWFSSGITGWIDSKKQWELIRSFKTLREQTDQLRDQILEWFDEAEKIWGAVWIGGKMRVLYRRR